MPTSIINFNTLIMSLNKKHSLRLSKWDIRKLLDRVLLHKNENSIMCRSHNWANHTLSFKLHSVATYQHHSVLMNKSTFLMKL